MIINDLSAARFDVRVSIGKSFSTQRMEARESMLDFIRMMPDAAPFVVDLLAKNMDWPGSDEIAKRLRMMVPPQALADPNNPPPPPNPMDDPQVAAEVGLKQAQAEKTIAEAEKLRREASLPVNPGQPETPDEERLLKRMQAELTSAQVAKVHAEIGDIQHRQAMDVSKHQADTTLKFRQADAADEQRATDTHFKGRQ